MLHVPALPGSPRNELSLNAIIDWVLTDANALAGGGTDGLIVENFGDVPFYPRQVPPHTVGPGDFQPGTAWEIHPISSIEFTE